MPRKKIRILIDLDAAASVQKSGVGYYSLSLLRALANADPKNTDITCHYFNFLSRNNYDFPEIPNVLYKQSKLMPRKVVNMLRRIGLNIPYEFLTRAKSDFIVFPNFTARKTLLRTPFAVVIHDLTYMDHPEYVSNRNRSDLIRFVPASLISARFVITISQATKRAIMTHYPWLKKPIVTELIPAEPKKMMPSATAVKRLHALGIHTSFILFIGNIEPRKNILGLVKAYALLPENLRKTHALVITGGGGWNNQIIHDEIELLTSRGDQIITTDYVTEEDRTALYTKTSVLVFPSFYEGYGIPLLEAMSYDVPVVASNLEVFQEVAGNAALYCNPNDTEDISRKLEQALTNDTERKRLILAGRANIRLHTWDDLANNLLTNIKNNL